LDGDNLYAKIIKLQENLANRIIMIDDYEEEIEFVCGVDVSYKKGIACCAAVIVERNTLEVVEVAKSKDNVKHPYIPGLFILRESGPILRTLKLLKNKFQLLLVDGHGMLHPRRCGLASYVGLVTNTPTIGVAKKLLCGSLQEDGSIKIGDDVLGYAIKREDNLHKKIYVSIGHRISLVTSIQLVKSLTKKGEPFPEPIRIADFESKNHGNKGFAEF
jgi:deoxyribonuclease V